MKKLFAWILMLAMVLSLVPMGVVAAEPESAAQVSNQPEAVPETTEAPEEPAEDGVYEIPFQVNPLYREAYESGELEIPKPEKPASQGQSLENAPDLLYATYVTPEKGAELLRKSMVQRETTVNLYIKSGRTDYGTMFEEIMLMAMEHTGKPKEGDYLLWHYSGFSAQVSRDYTGSGYNYHFAIQFAYLTTAEQEQEMDTAVNQLLNQLGVRNKRPYEKVKAVYDHVCQNITYDHANLDNQAYTLKHSAYAALIHKTAVCQGYASLVYRLLLELGVDNRLIAGEAAGGAHGWNIVKLGNVYYNLDATWDAGVSSYDYFLKNQINFLDHARYMEYASTQFHMDYPMSETDYVDGVEGVPEEVFVFGMCGDNAVWGISRDGVLAIAGTGETYDYENFWEVTEKTAPWKYWADGFRHVVIDEGITTLGKNAFNANEYYVKQIESVTLPDSLVTIGEYAFKHCWALTEINWGNGLETIGSNAFEECNALREVRLPASLKTMEWAAFTSCDQLQTVILNDGLERIRDDTFSDCGQLQQIHIPGSVKAIESRAFDNCNSLTEIRLPASVNTIGSYAFRNCDALTEICLPASLKELELGTFDGCDQLRSVTLNEGLETIGSYAFSGCSQLQQIQFPASVKTIGSASFDNCDSLTEVRIPATVQWVEGFRYCDNLQTVYIESAAVGIYAFYYCSNLRNVYLSDNVTQIGDCAFQGNPALSSISIPGSVSSLGSSVFRNCANLQEVCFTGDAPEMDVYVFYGYNGIIRYPAGNPTWTEEVMASAAPTATWLPYCLDHHYEAVTKETTCVQDGGTFYTCPTCQDTYVENFQYATGLHIFANDQDTTCEFCGYERPIRESRPVVHMFRMYDPNSGEHFYTGSTEERDNLVAVGWNYEGVGFTFPLTTGDPVHRLYDPVTGEHLYTMDVEEKDALMAAGWNYEGVAFNSAFADEVPQYRLHNPNETRGAYHFTSSVEERDFLLSVGWEYQGIGWYSCWK